MTDDTQPLGQADFNRLFLAERLAVYRHLKYLTGDPELAEDLTQETFSRLLEQGREDLAALRNPRAWLLRVASNLAYNHFRSEQRRIAREEAADEPDQPDVEDVLDVRRALGSLESRDRTVLLLRHSGFSYAEIAEAVDLAKTSVGTILARAQNRFRIAYESGQKSRTKE